MEVVQLNLNHCELAQDILWQSMVEMKCDIALISEPFNVPENNGNWASCKAKMTAIHVGGGYPIQEIISNGYEGFVIVKVNGVYFCSCYAPPRWTIDEFERMLDVLTETLLNKSPVIIGGDLNAWAEEWSSRLTNRRGQSTLEALAKLNVLTANEGSVSTFSREGRSSIVDVTFCSPSLKDDLNWRVTDSFTASDHQAIRFTVGRKQATVCMNSGGARWQLKLLNKGILRDTFEWITGERTVLSAPELIKAMTNACDAAMPRRFTPRKGKKPAYWWNDEIASLRAKCLKTRRQAQRARTDSERAILKVKHKEAKAELRHSIAASKKHCFQRLCEEVNKDPWGDAYRMVMAKLKGPRTIREMCPVRLKAIVEGLFPTHNPFEWPAFTQNRERQAVDDNELSVDELLEATKSLKLNKAPGPDGIPNVAVMVAVKARPKVFLDVMQKCLDEGRYPSCWKQQKVVLIPKHGRALNDPSSYRPICLLDTLGKLFEKIILQRLTKFAEGENGLSKNQFGFRKGKSTLEAILTVTKRALIARNKKKGGNRFCGIITLDVRNAFNSVSWSAIAGALDRLDLPEKLFTIIGSYFSDRVITYETEVGVKRRKVSAGVPQGGNLSTVLWNLMYDGVLRLDLPEGVEIVGFADDLVLTVMGDSKEQVEVRATRAIGTVVHWMTVRQLKVAHAKTEMVLVSNCKQIGTAQLELEGCPILSKRQVKYLGVMIDDRLNFNSHIDYICDKASRSQAAIARLMPNRAGPKSSIRKLIASVVLSILRYGCVTWADALERKRNRMKINSVYRLAAVRVASAYRTVSYDAVCVIARMIPIVLVILEDCRCYDEKSNCQVMTKPDRSKHRGQTIQDWQAEWDKSDKGRWTYRLIPSIKMWMERPHGEVNFHLTEFLSGHGGFREYLHRIGRAVSPNCSQCNLVETPEHVFFDCPRFMDERKMLYKHIDPATRPESLVEAMCKDKSSWDAVDSYVYKIMKILQELWEIDQVLRS
jgi:Reverse transcriptase (RNA-dependent DNA polymerase)/Endonuclease-reverse transcriptase